MKTIYISGKVTNLCEEATEKRFKEAEEYLRSKGHTVIDPVDLINSLIKAKEIDKDDRNDIMRYLISVMVIHCDTIYMLDGWQDSEGANQELKVARAMNFEVIFENENKI